MLAAAAESFAGWRQTARALLARDVPPAAVAWAQGAQADLLGTEDAAARGAPRRFTVPRELADLLEACACHRDPARWALMYRILWRATHGERNVLALAADDDVRALHERVKAVNRDGHKMKAFVRFRERRADDGGVEYVAWFEPEHRILARVAPFFAERFRGMRWTIVTPEGAARWDGERLAFVLPEEAGALHDADPTEGLWREYYRRIFNPSRLNVPAMTREMPVRYWKNLPEATLIPELVSEAAPRVQQMIEAPPAAPLGREPRMRALPEESALDACRRCPLWRSATQAVPGRGPEDAALMLVGEQPGDEEDLRGEPFVGPAGRLLDRVLGELGIPRDRVYVTNAVKHFKWEPRGKRRLHKTPAQREIEACAGWLDAEIERVRPRIIVALGATALTALGVRRPVGAARAERLWHRGGAPIVATYHPAAILRGDERGPDLHAALRDDLARAWAGAS